MSELWHIMNKPKLEITMMDEAYVIGFIILALIAACLAYAVIASWFIKEKK